ncbi:MAG TPA: undecaprenyl-diphosphatase [Nitrospirae bacterium]|nr:undecaprenyl-diphosphatase [Nitrospirota bacterium]
MQLVEGADTGLKVMEMSGIEAINSEIFRWINRPAGREPALDYIATFFAEGGLYILIVLLVLLWFAVDKERRNELLLATEASLSGLLLNFVITLFYFHPRPFMIGTGHLLIPHEAETSFPSDHVTVILSASVYLLLSGQWISLGMVLLVIAILTAWGRVYCGIHFPFDMLGSLAVSFIASLFIYITHPVIRPLNRKIIRLYDIIFGRFIS